MPASLRAMLLLVFAAFGPAAHADPIAGPDDFGTLARVLRHPRCLNCHAGGDAPRQGDERRIHDFGVVRGPDGHGAAAMRCMTCHTDSNFGALPGAPHWGLAPKSMAWEGLDDAALCRRLLDRRGNGGRDPAALLAHLGEDPLVAWAWQPGAGRQAVPTSRATLVEATAAWIRAGARCPSKR